MLGPDSPIDQYRDVRAAVASRVKDLVATPDTPDVVAGVVVNAATASRPSLRYTAGALAGRLRFLRRFAPAGMLDTGVRKDLRLDAQPSLARST